MKRLLYIFAFLVLCAGAQGQSWSGVLDPARGINWSNAGATIPNYTTPCATVPAIVTGSGNGTANKNAINAAITASMGGAGCYIDLTGKVGIYHIAGTRGRASTFTKSKQTTP